MDVKKMKKLGVPESVVREFNERLDDYIEAWTGAIDEHRQATERKEAGMHHPKAEDAQSQGLSKRRGMKKPFIELVHRHIAETSLGPSTLRNQGAPGVLQAARDALARADLGALVGPRETFERQLDRLTERVRRDLPDEARRWGTARKAVNVFLRHALYNTYLSRHFSLTEIEPFLELPLDSYTVAGLRREYQESSLPRWPGVANVTREVYAEFQAAASKVAAANGLARVHLDIKWWRRPFEESR